MFWNFLSSKTSFLVFATPLQGFYTYFCFVRFRHLLFTLYIFALAFYPCGDGKTCLDEKKIGRPVVSQSDHNHTSYEKDICSPFCICSCCAATIQLTVSNVVLPSFVAHNTRFLIPYKERPLLSNSSVIWQPPKAA